MLDELALTHTPDVNAAHNDPVPGRGNTQKGAGVGCLVGETTDQRVATGKGILNNDVRVRKGGQPAGEKRFHPRESRSHKGIVIDVVGCDERIEQVDVLGVESLGKREGKGCKRCCVHDPSPVLLSGT